MVEETKTLLDSGEVIAGIIGAFAATFFSYFVDWLKNYKKNESIRNIILLDLDIQIGYLNGFMVEYDKILESLKNSKYIEDTKNNNIIKLMTFTFSDNVYKSNTMIEYHEAFGDIIFINFLLTYEGIILIKKNPPDEMWIKFKDDFTKNFNSKVNDKDKGRIELEERHCRIIENQLELCEVSLNQIGTLKNEIKNLGIEAYY